MNTTDKSTAEAGLLVRLTTADRPLVQIKIDGQPSAACAGDTVLTALLTQGHQLRRSEFSAEPRAGFCLMGACQDCWVSDSQGRRFRSCSTPVRDGMDLITQHPEDTHD